MTKLRKPISFETTFGTYTVDELLGEGGAGRVYGGIGIDGKPAAVKVLAVDRATGEKRRRFKNEIAFLTQNKHPNIVTVIDHGLARDGEIVGPFYVMQRYHSNLRQMMRDGVNAGDVPSIFSQILDGVEAAHLKGVVHRDLKPENILHNRDSNILAIADFGVARFTEDLAATIVVTGPTQRLANFQYAAPEQRLPGSKVQIPADIYALGMILNEMFTGVVPHGTDYRKIQPVATEYSFLDGIVEKMLKQNPSERPASIADIKSLIERYEAEAVSRQRLSEIEGTVIRSGEIDEPLAWTPPKLIGADWNQGYLTLLLDRPVTQGWISALRKMGRYTSIMGKGPEAFSFLDNKASVAAQEREVQQVINYFKDWLPLATQALKLQLEQVGQQEEAQRKQQLRREREQEEQRLRVLSHIKI